ncbi:uncharacterized protein LOC110384221 [Helicoverpa armigera]|uniref:uncharacterized protein LOC110384221 n=1 Tax=Helicoverpa armigera TaxID=29058 RepID=UPI003082DC7F
MTKCSAHKCKNVGVHTFPKDEKRRKQWEAALRIKDFKAGKTARLCSAHFTEEDYFGQSRYTNYKPLAKFLKKTAVPTVFNFNKTKNESRLQLRSQKNLPEESAESDPLALPSNSIELERNNLVEIKCEKEATTRNSRKIRPTREYVSVSTQIDHRLVYGSIARYRNNDAFIKFSTGFESYKKFYLVYSTLSPMVHKITYENNLVSLSTEDQFFMTMMKLWQNKCNYELSMFYDISESTVSIIFQTWVNFIYKNWGKIDVWPKDEMAIYYLPKIFKHFHLNIEVMSGGTQIKVEKNSKTDEKISSHKDVNTSRIIVGEILGLISGQSSEQNDLVTKSKTGNLDDTVLPDKNMLINTSEHIERIIEISKTFKILQHALNPDLVPIASKIFFVCFMCCYFREGNIREEDQ